MHDLLSACQMPISGISGQSAARRVSWSPSGGHVGRYGVPSLSEVSPVITCHGESPDLPTHSCRCRALPLLAMDDTTAPLDMLHAKLDGIRTAAAASSAKDW